ncbi:MAG: hypothetical protein KJ061_02950 [Vicinamibacteraceae bacterium]|nr:hypothetical protein [Vicinamibacteraceae bacterium]MCL4846220.1 hypothetical protein [Acidobacteriota bacterium]
MPQLTGAAQPVALGGGYFIRAPGVRGQAELRRPRTAGERSRSRTVDDGTTALDAAFSAAGVTEVRQIDLSVQPQPSAAATTTLRSVDGRQDALELVVPDLGPETGQLVLACDEMGVLTWHLPIDEAGAVETPTTRGSGGTKRFRIPATRTAPPPPADSRTRSLLGVVGRKLLKVLVYPITDPVIGAVSEFFAERWEQRHRPYGLRDFSPGSFRLPAGAPLGDADWPRLATGPALLFVHGTFSTAHGAFSQIPDAVFAELHARYGGRVFAFDHFTLSHDPARNLQWLADHLPALDLDVDIVCHSRGGLVARALAERPASLGVGASRVRVGRIVFVGVPNAGTLLAHPAHMVAMIDRLTTALNLFPSGAVAETLEAILTAIKVIGHGVLNGLDGLAAMQPGGAFLAKLNTGNPPGDGYHAIGADYEPVEEGLKALVAGTVADAVLDRVFEDTPNDLVVPEPGVFEVDGSGAFPIPEARRLRVPPEEGVIHTTLFGHPAAAARLLDWLGARS